MLSTVNVPPPKSSRRSLFALARAGHVGDRDVQAVDRELVRVADDRHDQPVVDRHGHADVDPALGHQALLGPVGVERRGLLEGDGGRLDDERDEAEADPLLGLVVALGLLPERDETGRVDLHLDVGVRRLERPGHLGRDALPHLGQRDEDLVGAGRELDAGRGLDCGARSGRPGGRRRSRCGRRRGWRGRRCWRSRCGRGRCRAVAAGARPGRLLVPRRAADRLAADGLAGPLRLDVVRHVLAGDPPAAAGPDDLCGGQAMLAEQASNGRGHPGVGVARRVGGVGSDGRRGGGARSAATAVGARRGARGGTVGALVGAGRAVGRGERRRPSRGGRCGCFRGGRRGQSEPAAVGVGAVAAAPSALVVGCGGGGGGGLDIARPARGGVLGRLDLGDLGVVRDGLALLDEDCLQDPGERRRDLGVDLVGDDLEERLVLLDGVTGLLQPLADRPLGDALAELGHRHLGHCRLPPGRRADRARHHVFGA